MYLLEYTLISSKQAPSVILFCLNKITGDACLGEIDLY